MLYLALLTVLATTYGSPLPGQLFYYHQQPQQQYVKAGLLPYVQYQVPTALKALQSVRSPNDILYYPGLPIPNPQQELIKNQQGIITPASTARFTAPPQGLVDAIYAWFAENNLPVPEGPNKNEIFNEQADRYNKEKVETEADVLAEADMKKPAQEVKPGQRFYILNGQPQFVGIQPVVPSVVMRSALPEDQNLIFYQPQSELQQTNLKLRNSGVGVQNQEVFGPAPQGGFYFFRNNPRQQQLQQESQGVRPVRYHGVPQTDQVKNQDIPVPVMAAQNYPPHLYKQATQPQLIYHQILAPISVVPPQENQIYNLPQYNPQQAEVIPHNLPVQQPLSYIQIPVNNDVQIPTHYVKAVVPIRVNAQATPNQETKQTEKIPEIQSRFANQDVIEEKKTDSNADLAALEFVRYLENKENNDQYSDTVIIDAKTDDQDKEEQESESDDIVSADEPSDPTIAQAQPAGIALAGPGGIAATAPKATALAGERGLAISSPRATAVAGPNTEDSKPVKKS